MSFKLHKGSIQSSMSIYWVFGLCATGWVIRPVLCLKQGHRMCGNRLILVCEEWRNKAQKEGTQVENLGSTHLLPSPSLCYSNSSSFCQSGWIILDNMVTCLLVPEHKKLKEPRKLTSHWMFALPIGKSGLPGRTELSLCRAQSCGDGSL